MKIVLCLAGLVAAVAAQSTFDWQNAADAHGNKIPDFSYAGYHAGEKPLPPTDTKVTKYLDPGDGDQTDAIVKALRGLKSTGGVLYLRAGNYSVQPGIHVYNNTVLRGAGVGKTTLVVSKASGALITLGTGGVDSPSYKMGANITDKYVPVGSSSFTVSDTSRLSPGQDVYIQRQVTQAWIDGNNMSDLGPGKQWLKTSQKVQQPRVIRSVDSSSNTVTVNVPLTDQLDAKYMSPEIVTYQWPADSEGEIGIESLNIVLAPTCSGRNISVSACNHVAFLVPSFTQDSWIRNVQLQGYNNGLTTETGSRRISFDNITVIRDNATDHSKAEFSGYASDFSIGGHQTLISNSSVRITNPTARSYTVVTGSLVAGPNAVTNFWSQYPISSIQPHQKWAHGFLVDNSPGSVEFINRGAAGSGHGWTVNSAVAWNSKAANDGDIEIDSPPLGTNWGIGGSGGKRSGDSKQIYADGSPVLPQSLFVIQRKARGLSTL